MVETTSVAADGYVAGVCNIGPAEIGRRRRAGIAGAVATAVLFAALLFLGAAPPWHLLVFAPAMMAATGFVQARSRFCVAFGLAALFNFGDLGGQKSVAEPEWRRRDRARAWRLIANAGAIAAGVTAAAVLVAALVS